MLEIESIETIVMSAWVNAIVSSMPNSLDGVEQDTLVQHPLDSTEIGKFYSLLASRRR